MGAGCAERFTSGSARASGCDSPGLLTRPRRSLVPLVKTRDFGMTPLGNFALWSETDALPNAPKA
jgi:hypothetical protein